MNTLQLVSRLHHADLDDYWQRVLLTSTSVYHSQLFSILAGEKTLLSTFVTCRLASHKQDTAPPSSDPTVKSIVPVVSVVVIEPNR